MTMNVPPEQRAAAFAAVAAAIEPKDNNVDMEDALKVYQEESDAQLKEDLKAGLGTWEKLKPAAQYQGFVDETLHVDNEYVLDPGYWDLRRAGYAPPLLAETMLAEYEAASSQQEMMAQQALMMGMPAPEMAPMPMKPPALWPLLLRCRSWVVEQVAAEYRRLDKEHRKREPEPMMTDLGYGDPMSGGY